MIWIEIQQKDGSWLLSQLATIKKNQATAVNPLTQHLQPSHDGNIPQDKIYVSHPPAESAAVALGTRAPSPPQH